MLASVVAAQLLALTTNICTTGSTRTCKLTGCAVAEQVCLQDRTWGACACNCDDRNACTSDTWSGNACVHTSVSVDDGNPCTADACDPVAGVTHVPLAAGASCSDADACNGAEVCDGGGACLAGTPPMLDDGNPCTIDSCDPVTGVTHEAAVAGASCSDGDYCNGFETCDGVGSCLAGLPPAVDDQNACTVDRCDPALGVFHDPVAASTPCGDANACNGVEVCDAAGLCLAGTPPVVDDGYACTADACDAIAGVTHTPIPGCVVIPPDPATVAPPNDLTAATNVADSTAFLYTGTNPIQRGVVPGTIEPRRAAVVRGRVIDRNGDPLSGVTVTIAGHPELGSTVSRADGRYDMAVNGGGRLLLAFGGAGSLPTQRSVDVAWNDYATVPDVVLVALDLNVTTVELGAPGMQAVRGSILSDGDGVRQATLLVPALTQATLRFGDGTTQAVTSLNVRATEYTVGPNGPAAMPAELPPASAYTYAVELSADEAIDSGAEVEFSQPVAFYVDNFLGLPVGEIVPAGWYDRVRGLWVPSPNGRVIGIVTVANGLAELDTNGDALPDDAATLAVLGIGTEERERLAVLYQPGDTVWRTRMSHFTPYDLNLPAVCRNDCPKPNAPPPLGGPPDPSPCEQQGSRIECQNQVLGEEIPIVGTPFRLVYRSDRVPGRAAERTITMSVTGSTIPAALIGVVVKISVAGQTQEISLPPTASQQFTYTWDGKDAYGRSVQGEMTALVELGYLYQEIYLSPSGNDPSFAAYSVGYRPLSGGRSVVGMFQRWRVPLTALVQPLQDLGAWSLDVHHAYDPIARVLMRGDGAVASSIGRSGVLTSLSSHGTFGSLTAIAPVPDGTLYVADASRNNVLRFWPDGSYVVAAGGGTSTADGVPATEAALSRPYDLSLASDGTLYVTENYGQRIRKVTTDGRIFTVAGNGSISGPVGDGGPATQATLVYPQSAAIAPDGCLYIHEYGRIRRVAPNGIISTITGGDVPYGGTFTDDGHAAAQSKVCSWEHNGNVSIDSDGAVITTCNSTFVLRITPDGLVHKFAGTGLAGYGGDGGAALTARISRPLGVTRGPDGAMYFADTMNQRVRRVSPEGIIGTVAGSGSSNGSIEGVPATLAALGRVQDVEVGADGQLYIADPAMGLWRLSPASPGLTFADSAVPSRDGRELYFFDDRGRHQRSVDAMTGRVLFTFQYDAQRRLASVTDGDGNFTRVERDSDGRLLAIVAPHGQRTVLSLGVDGRLASVANPAGDTVSMTYYPGGLLHTYTDPESNVHTFGYDALGRLASDADAAGGAKTLVPTEVSERRHDVTISTALGRTSTYTVETLTSGERRHVNTAPDGTATTTTFGLAENATTLHSDGSATNVSRLPDPRFGMESPVETRKVTTPSGLLWQSTETRSATLSNAADPLSVTRLVDTVAVNGHSYTRTYDASTRTVTEKTPEGRTTTMVLDATGRVTEMRPPGVSAVSMSYDSNGRLWRVVQASRSWTTAYDADGYPQTLTDPLQRTVSMTYDLAGRTATQTLPGARAVAFGYDRNGNLTSVVPPGKPTHGFGYDAADRMTSYTPPSVAGTGPTTYGYDLDGMLAQVLLPDARTIVPSYYPLTQPPDVGRSGKLASLTTWRGTTSFDHDLEGRLSMVTAPDGGTVSFGYDGFLATAESWSGSVSGSIGRGYDANFRVTSTTLNGADALSHGYDNDALLTQAGALTIAREAATGRVSGTTLGVVTTTPTYDATYGELATFTAKASASPVYSYSLTRDLGGRITGKTEIVQGVTTTYEYGYDDAGRLWTVKVNGSLVATYVYDSNGNRLSRTTPAASEEGSYDDQDRMLTYGGATYTYGASGDLESKTIAGATTWYSYDPFGNLVWAQQPDGTTIDYVVDGLNRRIGKKVNGTLAEGFLYDGQLRPVAWLDGTGAVKAAFVYGLHVNVPEYMTTSSGTYRFIHDHLGSPTLVVDSSSGAVVQRMDYDSFGQVLNDTNPGFQPFGFAGGLWDRDTGLVRFGARDYDPWVGRWTNKDPIRFNGGTTNLYEYVGNDPVNFTDPSGRFWAPPPPPWWARAIPYIPWAVPFIPSPTGVDPCENSPEGCVPRPQPKPPDDCSPKAGTCSCTCVGSADPTWNPTDPKHGDRNVGQQSNKAECRAECTFRGFKNSQCM